MVHPGAFHGSRKEFLLGEKAAYGAGVDGGYAADALALIQRRYFKRYPIDLPHDEEPEPEALASVDYNAPDVEEEMPDDTQLGTEEYAAAMLAVEERGKAVAFHKAQIKRWLAYQHMKDRDMDPKESGAHNPYRVLLHKLTGSTIHCPRRRTATNVWRKTQRKAIEDEVKIRAAALGTKLAGMAALRDKVAKELYSQLASEEKYEWEMQAREEHDAAVKSWKEETEGDLSTDPKDRQQCIYGLVKFMQPILDLVCEATGWSATLMTGGPEPAHGGRLNVISIHSGTTSGDIKMTFGRAERLRYKSVIVPIYGQFLQQCYSLEECRARALPVTEGFEGVESMGLQADDVDFDSVKTNTTTGSLSGAPTAVTVSSTAANAVSANPEPAPRRLFTPTPSPTPSRGLSPALSRPRSRSHSREPSPAISPPGSPIPDPPTPASINSILDAVSSPPAAQPPCASHNAIPHPPVHNLADASKARGRKRQADATTSTAPIPKRTRASYGASASVPSPVSHSIVPNNSARHASNTKRSRGARNLTALATSPPPQSSGAPPSTRATRSTHATAWTSTIAPSGAGPFPAHTFEAAPDAPSWFLNALAMLQCDDPNLGDSWKKLIGLWVAFEIKENYGHDLVGKLKAKNRPTVLKDWIQRARSATWRPVISNVAAIEKDFGNWWASLQPEWRVEDGGQLDMSKSDGDWEPLRQPGVNGLLTAVAGLFFWGLAAHADLPSRAAWSRFVNDCIVVFNGLLTTS